MYCFDQGRIKQSAGLYFIINRNKSKFVWWSVTFSGIKYTVEYKLGKCEWHLAIIFSLCYYRVWLHIDVAIIKTWICISVKILIQ